ncbi:transcription termination factor, mitochondrial-like [Penaeus monodon]|uniref:transcription termination factor, mitochondrial-like n=1 Tax=Penaeus monodon TaxID=6687 RepID=UPI0018A7204C|nr:transcription termination factor, mitochondrial-like [Penaeus monodon]
MLCRSAYSCRISGSSRTFSTVCVQRTVRNHGTVVLCPSVSEYLHPRFPWLGLSIASLHTRKPVCLTQVKTCQFTLPWGRGLSSPIRKKSSSRLRKDDEAEEENVAQNSSDVFEYNWLEDGEFFDNPYHQDRKIQPRDIGKKVSVSEPVISELNNLFGLTRAEALHLVRSPQFLLVADGAVLKTLYFLKEHDIPSKQLKRLPWILLQAEDILQVKFSKLTDPYLFKSYSDGLGFCHFTTQQIGKYQRWFSIEAAKFPDHPNRLYYLAEMMKVPVDQLTERVVKPKRILFMDLERVEHITSILQRYEVKSEDILRDLWVYYHNPVLTEERLHRATEAGCERPKLWMCRCPDYIFERTCERYQSQKELLGEKSVIEYLAERLECEPEFIVNYARGNPGLMRAHVSKLKSQIDLLFSEGFTPKQIRASMRILLYAEKRTAERIKKLKEIGYFPSSVTVLYKTPKQFESYYQSLLQKSKTLRK